MAVTIEDGKKILTTPVSAEDLKDIHIGDIVYLTGDLTTCRDVAHRRVVEEGREIPVDVRDAAILHAGPIIRPLIVSIDSYGRNYFEEKKVEYNKKKDEQVELISKQVGFIK